MPDIPNIPEPALGTTPDATPNTPAEAAHPAPEVAAAPAPRPEPSVADTGRLLATHFPALFGEGVIKPIKLRIQADIHQRAPGVFTKKALSFFLQRHTTRTAYLRALVAEGATRVDLDGQPAGEIAAEHRDAAGVELERRRVLVEERKRAEREAARASRGPSHPPRRSEQAEGAQATSQAAGERPATRGKRSAQPATADRPDRSTRPPQRGQASPHAQPPRPGAPRGPGKPGKPDDVGSGAQRRPHGPRPERHGGAREQEPANARAPHMTPEQAAEAEERQRRALLLRSFEQSPLSKANFGALKGLSEEALDVLLTLARQERGSR
ncbi:MAG: prop effector ProQ [Rhizobacter sp.]|nr:prop effector ProQ [Rhizobacter sp.]